ncbi:MAG TPA: DUF4169 family protein [Polyangiaceae bacterium]|nr:DUF4169 family protein [Polyangiaceae bacterium]
MEAGAVWDRDFVPEPKYELCSEKGYGISEMGKVVNLNKFRKQQAKVAKERQAETNRRLHGRTKAERARDLLQKRKLETQVEGARLEGSAKDSDAPEE